MWAAGRLELEAWSRQHEIKGWVMGEGNSIESGGTYFRIAWSRAINLAKETTRCSSFKVPLI